METANGLKQTVDVDVVDEVDNLLLCNLKPKSIHDSHQLFGSDASVVVFVEKRKRFSQLLTHQRTRTQHAH